MLQYRKRKSDMVSKDKTGWIKDVLGEIQKHIKTRRYRITSHAEQRQEQYNITLPNLLFVLSTGTHEKEKTLFDNTFQTWKYAIRGKTIDSMEDLRIIVAFEDEMAVITVIRLNTKRSKNERKKN
jgi:hypothetical protein